MFLSFSATDGVNVFFVFSIHRQFPDSVVMVPEHIPENLVSSAALSHSDDQHASQWSVCFSSSLFTGQKLAQLLSLVNEQVHSKCTQLILFKS